MAKLSDQFHQPAIEALILSGGQARRMGGKDKGLILLHNQPLIAWTIEKLKSQVKHIKINANRNLASYKEFGLEVIQDSLTGFAGPLAGFHAGLKACEHELLLVVPCDSPLIDSSLVAKLLNSLNANQADLAYAATFNNKHEKQTHPVFCLMRRNLLPNLEQFLKNDRKIDLWFKQINAVEVIFENENNFLNINTPDELEKISKLI